MNGLETAKQQLLDEIRGSKEYIRFEKARKRIEGHPEEKEAIDAFRSRSFSLSNSEDPLEPPSNMEDLAKERIRVRENPLSAEYLDAELELCRMLQDICLSVIQVIDLQIETFESEILRG